MSRFQSSFRQWIQRPMIRPWGLLAPILVLLLALPMLRPLRHPGEIGDDEAARLLTIRSLVEQHSLAIPLAGAPASHAVVKGQQIYSDQPPVLSVLLAGPYW